MRVKEHLDQQFLCLASVFHLSVSLVNTLWASNFKNLPNLDHSIFDNIEQRLACWSFHTALISLMKLCCWNKETLLRWGSGYHYGTNLFIKTLTQVLHRFKSCLWYAEDWWKWRSLTLVPAGNKVKSLSLVKHTTKIIYHHHHLGAK